MEREQITAEPRRVLVVGATSGIGEAIARVLAGRGWSLVVTGRDAGRLAQVAEGLRAHGASRVVPLPLDATDFRDAFEIVTKAAASAGGPLDGVIVCHGWSPAEKERWLSAEETRGVIDANFTSAAVILSAAAGHLEQRSGGFLCAISSVAGDRGRPGNFSYGSAKAGLTAYCSGLRARLHRKGVAVLTVKPGYVDTPMLRALGVGRSWLVADPDRVARDIVWAIDRRRDILYTPWFWRWILLAVRVVPEAIFKRLRT